MWIMNQLVIAMLFTFTNQPQALHRKNVGDIEQELDGCGSLLTCLSGAGLVWRVIRRASNQSETTQHSSQVNSVWILTETQYTGIKPLFSYYTVIFFFTKKCFKNATIKNC